MTDQVNRQDVGEGFDQDRPSNAACRQLSIHGQHGGTDFRHVETVERWYLRPGGIEFERFRGHPRNQFRGKEYVERVFGSGPTPLRDAIGRHERNIAGRRRLIPFHPLVPKLQLFGGARNKDQQMMRHPG